MRLLITILLFFSLSAPAQRNVLAGGRIAPTPRTTASFTRQNLELEYTTEQSDAVTNFTVSSPPPTNNYFQALEKQTGYTAITRQNTVVRDGTWAVRVDVNASFPLDDRLRTELVYFSDITPLDTRRYAVSVYIPTDFDLTGTDWIECVQWHAWEDRTPVTGYDKDDGAKISPVGLYLDPSTDRWDLNIAYNSSNPTSGWTDAHNDLGPIVKGVWIDFVFFMKWDYRTNGAGGSGQTKVWMDGSLVFTEDGPNCYNDANGPYFKTGLHTPSSGKTNYLYLDEVRVGNASSTYNDVVPADGFVMNGLKISDVAKKTQIGSTLIDWIQHNYITHRRKKLLNQTV